MSIGDKARRAREEMGIDPRPISAIRAEDDEVISSLRPEDAELLSDIRENDAEPVKMDVTPTWERSRQAQVAQAAQASLPDPTPMSEVGSLAAALLQAMKGVAPQGISKEDLAEVMQSNAEGMRKALKPENARHPDVSVFNPRGERDFPKPALRLKTFQNHNELHADDLDIEEIDLLNKFTHTKEARNGTWRAEIRRTSSKGVEELHVNFPCSTVDERMELPNSLKLILLELHGGTMAVDPMALAARVADLEAKLARA
jgi:hypothetical protein